MTTIDPEAFLNGLIDEREALRAEVARSDEIEKLKAACKRAEAELDAWRQKAGFYTTHMVATECLKHGCGHTRAEAAEADVACLREAASRFLAQCVGPMNDGGSVSEWMRRRDALAATLAATERGRNG